MESTEETHPRRRRRDLILPAAVAIGVLIGWSGHWLGTTGALLVLLALALFALVRQVIRQRPVQDDTIRKALDDFPAAPPQSTPPIPPRPSLREPPSVLLLADDASPVTELEQWLHSWGIGWTRATRPGEALHRLLQAQGDGTPFRTVIVFEGRLGIGSDQLAALLRGEPALRDLQLLHIGAGTRGAGRTQLQHAGYSRLLARPLDKTLLYQALHERPRSSSDGETGVISLMERYTSRVTRQPLNILLADSDGADRHRARNLLRRMGHEVFVADDGIHVLDALDSHRFDLAIVSLDLNRASGLETFQLHHFSRSGRQEVPFIILLERPDRVLLRRCQAAGVDGILIKPLDTQRLAEAVETAAENTTGTSTTTDSGLRPGGGRSREIHGVLLDTQRLAELDRLGGSSDFMEKLVDGFQIEGRRLIRQLEEAARGGDQRSFRDLCQALSDIAGNVGAFDLHRASVSAGRTDAGDFPTLAIERTAEIRQIHENTQRALRSFLSECDHSHRI